MPWLSYNSASRLSNFQRGYFVLLWMELAFYQKGLPNSFGEVQSCQEKGHLSVEPCPTCSFRLALQRQNLSYYLFFLFLPNSKSNGGQTLNPMEDTFLPSPHACLTLHLQSRTTCSPGHPIFKPKWFNPSCSSIGIYYSVTGRSTMLLAICGWWFGKWYI